ncbi:MAG: 2-phosphosulfolactate phosphatase [Halanaerobiaceae bacterium]
MNIEKLSLFEGAQRAEGMAVIIDVFRAFSLACYILAAGAKKIIPVQEIETAYKLKDENPDYLLVGEREGKIQPGFDYGNSPSRLKDVELEGKTIIHTTSAGTQGLLMAERAETVVTGSFVNAGAVVSYIRRMNPDNVSLVSLGIGGQVPSEEDELCADYIQGLLSGEKPDFQDMKKRIKKSSGRRFFEEDLEWSPREDFELCMRLNYFNFVVRADKTGEQIYLQKVKGVL